jgi:flavin reductase (DIM6/NTAB) family NADH-FMN oxidoreductase RutF
MMKQTIPIRTFWYADKLVMPLPIGIITTVNNDGIVNAAPYSLISPYNVSGKSPQMMMALRRRSHTFKNIVATGEFVVNFPRADQYEQINEVFRFYPEGVNELDYTSYTAIDSRQVSPPSIKECPQQIECRLAEHTELGNNQGLIIGDIVEIVMDSELVDLGRGERIAQLNMPVYLGDERRRLFFYGAVNTSESFDIDPVPRQHDDLQYETRLSWDAAALEGLEQVPDFVRQIVVDTVEEAATKEGRDQVTHALFMELLKKYAPPDVLERFLS